MVKMLLDTQKNVHRLDMFDHYIMDRVITVAEAVYQYF